MFFKAGLLKLDSVIEKSNQALQKNGQEITESLCICCLLVPVLQLSNLITGGVISATSITTFMSRGEMLTLV